jgi:hypothetical protein
MRAVDFEGSNAVYAKGQKEYLELPSYKTPDGIVTSCYKPTFWETVHLLFGAKIWVSIMTFNKPLQPQQLLVGKTRPMMEKQYHVSERE